MIGGGELRVDPEKIAAITQWHVPTNMTKARSFMGAIQYLRKFIIKLSTTTTTLHSLNANGKSFHWGRQQQRAFEYLKKKINNAPILAMSNF
jgi:hypothetical protein